MQIHGSGTGNWNNRAIVDESLGSQFGRLLTSTSGGVQLFGTDTNGSQVGPANLDNASFSISTIELPHKKVHDGDHFFLHNFDEVDSGLSVSIGVDTQNGSKWAHLNYQVNSNLITLTRLWEGATLSGGTTISAKNNNRNSTNTSVLDIKKNVVVSGISPTSGTLLTQSRWGLAAGGGATTTRFGGGDSRESELILKSGTTYLIELRSLTDNNIIDYESEWYESADEITKW